MLLCSASKVSVINISRQKTVKSWQTEALIRANAFSTTRWRWGGCCRCWGPPRPPAPTTSVSRTACPGQVRATQVSDMRRLIRWLTDDHFQLVQTISWWWWLGGCWWLLWCISWDQIQWETTVPKENPKVSTDIWLWKLTDGWLFQVQEVMARVPETRLHLWARHPSWVTDLWYYHQCGRHGDFFTHQPFASVILFRLRKILTVYG